MGEDLINSIKGNKSIMRGRPKGQQVVTIVTQNDQEGILRYPVFAIVFCCSPQGGIYHEKRQLDKHLFNHQAFIQLSTIKHSFDHQLFIYSIINYLTNSFTYHFLVYYLRCVGKIQQDPSSS